MSLVIDPLTIFFLTEDTYVLLRRRCPSASLPGWWLIRFTTSPVLYVYHLSSCRHDPCEPSSLFWPFGHSECRVDHNSFDRIFRHRCSELSTIIRRVHIAILRQTVDTRVVKLRTMLSQLTDASGLYRRGRDRRPTAARGRRRGWPCGRRSCRRFRVHSISCRICSENFLQLSIVGSASCRMSVSTL